MPLITREDGSYRTASNGERRPGGQSYAYELGVDLDLVFAAVGESETLVLPRPVARSIRARTQ